MRLVLVEAGSQIFQLPKDKCACGMTINYGSEPSGDCHIYMKTERKIIGKPVFKYVTKEI